MTVFFGRTYLVTVGDVDVSALDVQFDVVKSTKSEPNTCELRIFNLSPDTRASVEAEDAPRMVVRAGYEADGDPPPMLFTGDARRVYTEREGLDLVTTIQGSDRGRDIQTARISKSYNPGTAVTTVLRDAVSALGIGEGNLSEFLASYSMRNGSTEFADGYVADGPARLVLDALVRAANLRWSVQNGNLQLLQTGQALQSTALRLTPQTGLVGTPTRNYTGSTAAERRKVTCQAFILAGVEPGRRLVLESENIEGSFEVRQTVYKGDSTGTDWYANLELAPLA